MNEPSLDIPNPIVLFDGVCNLCSGSVQFIIKRDKKNIFRFASLQSDVAAKILVQQKATDNDFTSFLLIQDGKIYNKSTAALKVAKQLTGATKLLYSFIIIPPFIRDAFYNLIARNRYNWFGKKESCWLPTPELKCKFLDTPAPEAPV